MNSNNTQETKSKIQKKVSETRIDLFKFFGGVLDIIKNLHLPSYKDLLGDCYKTIIVVGISAILFGIIDSLVAPIAKFVTSV